MPRKRHHRIDLPGHLSDESAVEISEFLEEITRVFESRYYAQIQRYYNNLRAEMMSSTTTQRLHSPDTSDTDTDPF